MVGVLGLLVAVAIASGLGAIAGAIVFALVIIAREEGRL